MWSAATCRRFFAGTTCRHGSTAFSGAANTERRVCYRSANRTCAEPRMLSGLCLSDKSLRQRKRRQVSALQSCAAL